MRGSVETNFVNSCDLFADCQSPCPEVGVPHVAIVPMKATNSSQKEIIAGEERPKYFTANKIDNSQTGGLMVDYLLLISFIL